MKKIFLTASLIALSFAQAFAADYTGSPVLPPLPRAKSEKDEVRGKITPIPITKNDRKNTAKSDVGPIEVAPPTSEVGKKLWQQCSEIAAKEGKPYQYLVGKLMSKALLTENQIGDKICHYPGQKNCPTIDETKEDAWYDAKLAVGSTSLRLIISSNTSRLKNMDAALPVERNYMMCAYYLSRNGWGRYVTTHLETLKEIE